tara:strand:+ start:352 stop:573 length:222 start_codon:yes stop_codon:yes gene_type:complete
MTDIDKLIKEMKARKVPSLKEWDWKPNFKSLKDATNFLIKTVKEQRNLQIEGLKHISFLQKEIDNLKKEQNDR